MITSNFSLFSIHSNSRLDEGFKNTSFAEPTSLEFVICESAFEVLIFETVKQI
jgi:hypothetical protein